MRRGLWHHLIIGTCISISSMSYASRQFLGSCFAGPIVDVSQCTPLNGIHVENGYDVAWACASESAISDCKIAGFKSCKFLTSKNLGVELVRETFPERHCHVVAWVRGD